MVFTSLQPLFVRSRRVALRDLVTAASLIWRHFDKHGDKHTLDFQPFWEFDGHPPKGKGTRAHRTAGN